MGVAQLTHGDSCRGKETRLYSIWRNMKSRCTNPNKPDYKYYGANGIRVCDEWNDYSNFKEWAINNGYQDGLTLDRRVGNENYCPENCRWITIQEQQNNKKNNHILEFNGEQHSISEWSRILKVDRELIKDRILAGWDVERALTEPVKPKEKLLSYNGETHNFTEWANITGITRSTLYTRYNDMNWSVEDTLTKPVKKKNKNK